MSETLTLTINNYLLLLHTYETIFISWGEWLFFSVLTFNLFWLFLWCGFEKPNLSLAMMHILKRIFIASIFYTVLLNPGWFHSILQSIEIMGGKLNGAVLNPSDIITFGIGMANTVIQPIHELGLLEGGFPLIIITIVYLSLLFIFISVAIFIAYTFILTSALITIACFFIGFGGWSVTEAIARRTIDKVLCNCMKLLGLYLVVSIGMLTFNIMDISGLLPSTPEDLKTSGFDGYIWLLAIAWLFYTVTRYVPEQMASLVKTIIPLADDSSDKPNHSHLKDALAHHRSSKDFSSLEALKSLAANAKSAISSAKTHLQETKQKAEAFKDNAIDKMNKIDKIHQHHDDHKHHHNDDDDHHIRPRSTPNTSSNNISGEKI